MRLVRWLLVLAAVVVAAVATAFAVLWFVIWAPVSTVGAVPFDQRLAIPPLAESRTEADGTRVFQLTAQAGDLVLRPGEPPAPSWGYDGDHLGPTLRVQRGETVRMEVGNQLDETTTVHWHGMHLPAVADGGPHQPIEPGETWRPSWTVDQPAATLWYHPHPHGATEEHVARGLAGMLIVDDPGDATRTALPHEYGVDDIPVIVQDTVTDDGELRDGGLGEDLLVNGTHGPYLDVTTERIRLRLLNASPQRVYAFGFSDERSFDVVASDGGYLHQPVPRDRLRLSPGERAEIVVALSPRDEVVLRSFAPDLDSNVFSERINGGNDEFDVLQLRAGASLRPSPELPTVLAPTPDVEVTGAGAREFTLQGTEINGRGMDMNRIDDVVESGGTEVWTVTNEDGQHHNVHVHGLHFAVLDVDGSEPDPTLGGWKDTVFLGAGQTLRLAVRLPVHADPDHPFMVHCHLLQHEDAGMMSQFVVVEPGQQAGEIDHAQH